MLLIGEQMTRFSAVFLVVLVLFFAAGFALQSMNASHETALLDKVATQVELNRIQLNKLEGEFNQLQNQIYPASMILRTYLLLTFSYSDKSQNT